jgi:hypothetical protein
VGGPNAPRGRRTFTPAIVVSVIFVVACAVFAVSFVGARGGLQLPVASRGAVALGSAIPSDGVPMLAPTPEPTSAPTVEPPLETPAATPLSTVIPSVPPPAPTFARPTLQPGDPLLALAPCAGHPTCFEYVVQRGDTLSGIISRFVLDFDVLDALNPELDDPNVIVVGGTLYLGRDPFARLDPCPNGEPCLLYVVEGGDSIAGIASRFGLTTDAILAANPGVPRPIVAGQVLRLPAT